MNEPLPLIQFDRVTKRFQAVVALEEVSFDVRAGECLALCGENGAGKSTLMKILSGVITDYDGRVLVNGYPVKLAGTRDAETHGINIIHQELNLVGSLSVAANLFLGRESKTPLGFLDERRMEAEAVTLFASLECQIDPRALVRSLRIGDQQLVEIAKALLSDGGLRDGAGLKAEGLRGEGHGASDGEENPLTLTLSPQGRGEGTRQPHPESPSTRSPSTQSPSSVSQSILSLAPRPSPLGPAPSRVLIMDEPTSALTEAEVERLFRIIGRLRERGVTIIYISHKMDEVFQLADRITVLRDGRVVTTLDRKQTSPREVTHLMVGRDLGETKYGANRVPGDVLLRVESLALPWPDHARQWRLKDISFHVRRGEVVGFAGLMGAGRTELLECLYGASSETPQGRLEFSGEPVEFSHPDEALRAGIALVTEDRKRYGLFPTMNVREHITLSSLAEISRNGFPNGVVEETAAEESIAALRIKAAGTRAAITSLSGGNQQKCIIARALRTNPQLLLLDDPTRGIDVGAKAEIYRLIDELCGKGLAIIMTSSELPELIAVCDRILVLNEGRLTGEFARGEFTEQRLMEAATKAV